MATASGAASPRPRALTPQALRPRAVTPRALTPSSSTCYVAVGRCSETPCIEFIGAGGSTPMSSVSSGAVLVAPAARLAPRGRCGRTPPTPRVTNSVVTGEARKLPGAPAPTRGSLQTRMHALIHSFPLSSRGGSPPR
ncbi:MAG: hypothetical protein ACR2NR_06420 [Solirubrobacteraceae bacterium]